MITLVKYGPVLSLNQLTDLSRGIEILSRYNALLKIKILHIDVLYYMYIICVAKNIPTWVLCILIGN